MAVTAPKIYEDHPQQNILQELPNEFHDNSTHTHTHSSH